MDTQVLIAGAGPTGLTLALDLGRRGVHCTIIEQKPAPQFLPKMERCNARSMEIYRRIGIADRIRAAGLPSHCPMDVFIVLSVVEPPLLHLPYPSVDEAKAQIAKTNDGSQPLEPYQLISQYTLEPLLKSIVEEFPSVTVRYGCEFLSFTQDQASVTATVKSDGEVSEIKAQYLVGCDGGSSVVRRQLGIGLQGDSNLLQLRQALYYCEDLYERIPIGKGRHYHVADGEGSFLIVQDSTRHFTLHSVVATDLSWKLAATFAGWGGPKLLASYEIERRQVGARNVAASGFATQGRRRWRAFYRPEIRERTAAGAALREALARVADVEQHKATEMIGAELGYRYVGSPLIASEPGEAPEHDFMTYVPTTWPGARLPHVWLSDGSAMQDRIGYGHGYTLLRLGGKWADTSALQRAFAAIGAPLQVLDIADERPRDVYGYDLFLLRPDMHVVWRGNEAPAEPERLAALATGH